ncbi:MAG: T9SS type A sorting domain-containing protein [Flavobacteriales bacterium]|nr:T9SS type A sorting domain-containing protein [Flavobacteriales bacterium]
MKNTIVLLVFCLFGQTTMAQCGPFRGHPVWPDSVGYASVNITECGDTYTSCLWDNGSTDMFTYLGIGTHTVTFFSGTTLMEVDTFQIVQDHWNLHQLAMATAMGVQLSIFGGIEPYMGGIFNGPACPPVADSTVVYLLQDGIAIDSITPAPSDAVVNIWHFLPYGHTYQTHVVDHSHCGSNGYEPVVTAYSSGTVDFMIDTQDSQGGSDGSITVNGLNIDPLAALPPPMPFTGFFTLFDHPDHNPAGTEQSGLSAYWENLPAGQYEVFFTPDLLCNPSSAVVTIDLATGIKEDGATPVALWPQPAADILHWSSKGSGSVLVHDAQGRLVLEGPDQGQLDISTLPVGIYQLQFIGGVRHSWARFLKK